MCSRASNEIGHHFNKGLIRAKPRVSTGSECASCDNKAHLYTLHVSLGQIYDIKICEFAQWEQCNN